MPRTWSLVVSISLVVRLWSDNTRLLTVTAMPFPRDLQAIVGDVTSKNMRACSSTCCQLVPHATSTNLVYGMSPSGYDTKDIAPEDARVYLRMRCSLAIWVVLTT